MKKKIYLLYMILLPIIASLTSCGGYEWIETSESAKVYIDNSDYDDGVLSWSGDTCAFGVANGGGILSFTHNSNSNENTSTYVVMHYGTIETPTDLNEFRVGELDWNNQLQGFGVLVNGGKVTIGDFDGDKINGIGVEYINGNLEYRGNFEDGQRKGSGVLYYPNGQMLYNGRFKNGTLFGDGIEYTENGEIKYIGKFKKGLYHGYGTLTDVNGSHEHVWHYGELDPVTLAVYESLYAHRSILTDKQFEATVSRFVAWERYYLWMYIGLGSFCAAMLCLGIFAIYKNNTDTMYNNTKKWNKFIVWVYWLLFGWCGIHRFAMKSKFGIAYPILLSMLICIQMRNITLYAFYPYTWEMWQINTITVVLTAILVVLWLLDFFYTPWRCYCLNQNYFYHDKNESDIIQHIEVPQIAFGKELPDKCTDIQLQMNDRLQLAQATANTRFEGKTGFFTRAGRAIIGSDPWLDFERDKKLKIEQHTKSAIELQNHYADMCSQMNIYLEEARNNAYRNLYLAKELIKMAVPAKSKRQELIHDVQLSTMKVCLDNCGKIDSSDTELGVDWVSTINNTSFLTDRLISYGIKSTYGAVGLAAGISILTSIFKAMQKADKAREQNAIACKKLLDTLTDATNKIIDIEASLLRSSEILVSLNKMNATFWQIYAPLRDKYIGNKATVAGFFHSKKITVDESNDPKFREDMAYLIAVCKEYNIVNQSKVK